MLPVNGLRNERVLWLILACNIAGLIAALLQGAWKLGLVFLFAIVVEVLLLCFRAGAVAFFAGIFFPGRRYDRPQPMYGPALSLRTQGRYDEALRALADIAGEYPDVARPYLEMLDICASVLHDWDKCQAVYQEGMLRLRDKDERQALERYFAEVSTDYR
ncbi:MAG: hypothetical protein GX902_12980 [Lentisphaerae bacterium]|nr:hypothetical protein [Lentisphaerota bacterium]